LRGRGNKRNDHLSHDRRVTQNLLQLCAFADRFAQAGAALGEIAGREIDTTLCMPQKKGFAQTHSGLFHAFEGGVFCGSVVGDGGYIRLDDKRHRELYGPDVSAEVILLKHSVDHHDHTDVLQLQRHLTKLCDYE